MSLIPTALIAFKVIEDKQIIEDFFMKLFRMTRLFSIFRLISVFQSQMIRVTFKFALTFIIIIFLFAACMMTIENMAMYQTMREEKIKRDLYPKDFDKWDESNWEEVYVYGYHDMLYYIVVTMTVVGFGDIYPLTVIG